MKYIEFLKIYIFLLFLIKIIREGKYIFKIKIVKKNNIFNNYNILISFYLSIYIINNVNNTNNIIYY